MKSDGAVNALFLVWCDIICLVGFPLPFTVKEDPLVQNVELSERSLDRELPCYTPDANQLRDEDRAAHGWYRFVLSFPPHLVRHYLTKFQVDQNSRVLDPFCGTGTTLVECKKQGIPSVGLEVNPMAYFASRVKLDWSLEAEGFLEDAHGVAQSVQTELELINRSFTEEFYEKLRTLPEASLKIVLKNSISPIPLHKTLVLLEQIQQQSDKHYKKHELLALARVVVSSISNLHFGPEVGVKTAKVDASVIEPWLSMIRTMAEDLCKLQPLKDVPADVIVSDSREASRVLKPCSIDAVVTSPPYPNEKDYTRTTRLESVILGLIRDKAELRVSKQSLLRSNTRNVYKADTDDEWVADHQEIQKIAAEIEAKRIELGKTSGFERLYPRVTKLYFGGMKRHLANLRPALRPGAMLAYVVGDQASYLRVMIRTGQLLAGIAESLGYEVVDIDLFRTRIATATGEQLREEVVILRWPGY